MDEGRYLALTVALVDVLSLFLEHLELLLVTIKVANGLTNECCELLEHNDAVHALLSGHRDRIDRNNGHVLFLQLLGSLW